MFMILMMIMIIFSQLAMEIYAYNFVVGKNIEKRNIIYLEEYANYKQRIADEQAKEAVVKQEQQVKGASSAISFVMPVKGGITTSGFGDKVSRNSMHLGHDWAVNTGTKVVAAAEGIVERAYYSESYGYNVLVSHGNGLETRYAHLSRLNVSSGEYVKQKQVLGLSGSTGDSTGPHLHFEVINNGKKVNPLNFLKGK
ncbi:MAG: M23 family metallopeptidase [Eubacterium sp.]